VSESVLAAEDVAANAAAAALAFVYAPIAAPPVGLAPWDAASWRDAVAEGVLSQSEMDELLARVNAVSALFGDPVGRWPALSEANYREALSWAPPDFAWSGGNVVPGYLVLDEHIEAMTLAAWLTLVAGYQPIDASVPLLDGVLSTAVEAARLAESMTVEASTPPDMTRTLRLLRAMADAAQRTIG
jgi:hypothetical protein